MGRLREKRKFERFDLQVETILEIKNKAKVENPPMLLSRDISCAGVFLSTKTPLPVGTEVDLNLLLNQLKLINPTEQEGNNISTSGKVVRINEEGMAIQFDELHKVSQLEF